jgi:hypothetical protein
MKHAADAADEIRTNAAKKITARVRTGRLKVVGGSGAYANASGSGRYVNISNTKTGVTIKLA